MTQTCERFPHPQRLCAAGKRQDAVDLVVYHIQHAQREILVTDTQDAILHIHRGRYPDEVQYFLVRCDRAHNASITGRQAVEKPDLTTLQRKARCIGRVGNGCMQRLFRLGEVVYPPPGKDTDRTENEFPDLLKTDAEIDHMYR